MHSIEIRKQFLDYFQSKEHVIRPSSPLLPPPTDSTLLFTTAGMLQFKPLWAGGPLPFKRAATVQKCLRAGGKGSDLENVGKTLRHHTFFEMLGNFSFGDYFKEEAIKWAWEFVVEVVKLPAEKLWVSIYLDDDEAYNIWKNEIGIDVERIVRLGKKDNFWGPAGATGACGPCSEMYYDLGLEKGCGKPECKPGCDCERYLEFWNLVFPQFDQQENGDRKPLERRGIDTGMGLERLAFLLQDDANNNYETDLFRPIIDSLKRIAKEKYQDDKKVSYHVIADHIRALTFSISENIFPANEGRGYVLRRLLRRAVRHGRNLGITEPFLHKLVNPVIEIMRESYPGLLEAREQTTKIVLTEEERFQHTLDYGLSRLDGIIADLQRKKEKGISGADIFKLYDTYGFPLDIMEEIAEEKGLLLDHEGFEKLMLQQKERARNSWAGADKSEVKQIYKDIQKQHGEQNYVGYEETKTKTNILAIVVKGASKQEIGAGSEAEIFMSTTPFYFESGGQVGDTGLIVSNKGEAKVIATKKILPGMISHKIKVKQGTFSVNDEVEAVVDVERRLGIARHHTATHLLQYCLREVLGDHVKQSGSFVGPEKLRFDFTHFAAIDPDELVRIQDIVNQKIIDDAKVETYVLSLEEALKKRVLAFFGEKYGETVRVLDIGGYSKELCGGTHINATGQIGLFRITNESSIAGGIRRIEAVCGKVSNRLVNREEELLKSITVLLKTEPGKLVEKVKMVINENKQLTKIKDKTEQQGVIAKTDALIDKAKKIDGIKVVIANIGNIRIDLLRNLGDVLRDKMKSGVIVLGAPQKDKVALLVVVTKDLTVTGYHAGNIIKDIAVLVGGRGGGKPEAAQAGGKNPELLDQALAKVPEIIKKNNPH